MFSKPYVRELCDTIINRQPLSHDQLFFLVDIVADYMLEYDPENYPDFSKAKFSLKKEASDLDDD